MELAQQAAIRLTVSIVVARFARLLLMVLTLGRAAVVAADHDGEASVQSGV